VSHSAAVDLNQLPSEIRQLVARAPLPLNYEKAKLALLECERVDEIKDWTDRLAAAAAYAKQAGDDALFLSARRLQLRAHDRLGQLLLELSVVKPAPHQKSERYRVIEESKMAPLRARAAIQIAQLDPQIKDVRIEQTQPPSVSALAAESQRLKRQSDPKRAVYPSKAWQALVASRGGLTAMRSFVDNHWDTTSYTKGLTAAEATWVRENVEHLQKWLGNLKRNLPATIKRR
jgi:hypothetical protein